MKFDSMSEINQELIKNELESLLVSIKLDCPIKQCCDVRLHI